jgi:hypothetical protein
MEPGVKDDKRKELEEAYEKLSPSEKLYVILYSLSRVMRHLMSQLSLRWLILMLQLELRLKKRKKE